MHRCLKLFSFCLAFNYSTYAYAAEPKTVHCIHYWNMSGNLVASGKKVGEDLGAITPTASGEYHCEVDLTDADFMSYRYLFLGNIGDSAYLRIDSINGNPVLPPFIIAHGLYPDRRINPTYYEMLPFFVGLETFFLKPGSYSFSIVYTDLISRLSGMRSGAPELMDIYSTILRALVGSKALLWHFVQLVFLVIGVFIFAMSSQVAPRRRAVMCLSAIASVVALVQVTGVPRMFGPTTLTMKLNDLAQLFSYLCINLSLASFFSFDAKQSIQRIGRLVLLNVMVVGGLLLMWPQRAGVYKYIYGYGTAGLTIFPSVMFFLFTYKKRIEFAGGLSTPTVLPVVVSILGLIFAFDTMNLVLFDSRYLYINQYFGWPLALGLQLYLLSIEKTNSKHIQDSIIWLRDVSLLEMATPKKERTLALSSFAEGIGKILGAKRVSIAEVRQDTFQFIGTLGSYTLDHKPITWDDKPALKEAIATGNTTSGFKFAITEPKYLTEYFVIPIKSKGVVLGLLCITDFGNGHLSAFLEVRLNTLIKEVEIVVALLIEQKRNIAYASVLEAMRHRTSPVQLKSEDYFFKSFEISTLEKQHSFILGDLNGSVGLNEEKGGETTKKLLDEYLDSLFQSFKTEGVILSRTNGDFISILFPVLTQEDGPDRARIRAIRTLEYLSDASIELSRIARSLDVYRPIAFRFVLGTITRSADKHDDSEVPNFALLINSAIDAAARVLSDIAQPEECIVIGDLGRISLERTYPLELPPTRLRGFGSEQKLYSLLPKAEKNAA